MMALNKIGLAGGFLAISLIAAPACAQDAAAGGALFKQRCAICHKANAAEKSVLAPNLAGVGNRVAGTTTFNYSPALKASKIKWTAANLDKFLIAPGKLVPGTRMFMTVPDPKARQNVVAYLMSLK